MWRNSDVMRGNRFGNGCTETMSDNDEITAVLVSVLRY